MRSADLRLHDVRASFWTRSFGRSLLHFHPHVTCWFADMQTDDSGSSRQAESPKSRGRFHILVGVTGSVAALKLPLLVSSLLQVPKVSSSAFNYCPCIAYDKYKLFTTLHLHVICYIILLLPLCHRAYRLASTERWCYSYKDVLAKQSCT